jgi:hypothetical protein
VTVYRAGRFLFDAIKPALESRRAADI